MHAELPPSAKVFSFFAPPHPLNKCLSETLPLNKICHVAAEIGYIINLKKFTPSLYQLS